MICTQRSLSPVISGRKSVETFYPLEEKPSTDAYGIYCNIPGELSDKSESCFSLGGDDKERR